MDIGVRAFDSQDALHTVLRAVVAPSAPVVNTLLDQSVNVTLEVIELRHSLTVREQPVLEIA